MEVIAISCACYRRLRRPPRGCCERAKNGKVSRRETSFALTWSPHDPLFVMSDQEGIDSVVTKSPTVGKAAPALFPPPGPLFWRVQDSGAVIALRHGDARRGSPMLASFVPSA